MNQSTTMSGLAGPVPYARMNGIGNAILVVDLRAGGVVPGPAARELGTREGFGFDQLMALHPPRSGGTDAFVEIINADGSQAGACGNGTRCVAWFLLQNSGREVTRVETGAGILECRRQDQWTFSVDMGAPRFGWHDIPLRDAIEDTRTFSLHPESDWMTALGPASGVSMGNPHLVFFLDGSAPLPPLEVFGPALEHHPMLPERANISFARVERQDRILLDVWERGAGLTRACGSAACATLVAAVRRGLAARRAEIILPGGRLEIVWREADSHVQMTGAVELERQGLLEIGPAT